MLLPDDRYFALLRFALAPDGPLPDGLATLDWQDFYTFALRQSLVGLLFRGVCRLPKPLAPPERLLMQWVAHSNAIRRENIKVSVVAGEIFEKFSRAGFRCCIFKGPGNALMYDEPYSRTPGDVDLWTPGYVDAQAPAGVVYPSFTVMQRKVVDYCQREFQLDMVRGHHAMFEYNGVEVEAHFAPSERANPKYNERYKRWFRAHADEQCNNYISLLDDCGRIAVPTLAFNLVYQLVHLFHHFFDMGIGLRQVVDYWHLLMKYDLSADLRQQVINDIRHLGLTSFAAAVMWVLAQTLHVPRERLLIAPDARRGQLLLAEIINGGNFGKYDTKYGDITRKGIGGKYFTKTYRNLSFVSYYPEEVLFEPFYRTYHFFLRKAQGW